MKQRNCEILSFNEKSFIVPINVYESVEEADKHAGKAGAVLEEANKQLLYRGAYADGRDIIENVVIILTGVEPKTVDTGKKDDKGNVIFQRDPKDSQAVFVKRALATKPELFEKVQAEVTAIALGTKTFDETGKKIVPVEKGKEVPLSVDIRQTERTPRVLKLAQKWKDVAIGFLDGKSNLAAFNKALKKFDIAEFAPSGKREDDILALGWKCKAFAEAQNPFASMAA